jgi:streptomycin 6-kinase
VLLHGDFIGKNLLRTADEYVAADPLPRLGDPCADVAAFAVDRPPVDTILDRAAASPGGWDSTRAGRAAGPPSSRYC